MLLSIFEGGTEPALAPKSISNAVHQHQLVFSQPFYDSSHHFTRLTLESIWIPYISKSFMKFYMKQAAFTRGNGIKKYMRSWNTTKCTK